MAAQDVANRRQFLSWVGTGLAGLGMAPLVASSWGFAEATHLQITRPTIHLPGLPARFAGLKIAFLTDLHYGEFVSQEYLAGLVRTTLALQPDLILLGGDYTHRREDAVEPCLECLGALRARWGVFGVLGNHDYKAGVRRTQAAMARAGIVELSNRGTWLESGGDRLRLAGVDDLWYGQPDVAAAVGPVRRGEACLLLSHNPDLAETCTEDRIGLILSGHTHGGQVHLPGFSGAFVPSRYGAKYRQGLVRAPRTQVYVSAGTGMSVVPVRLNCRPEISLITLQPAPVA